MEQITLLTKAEAAQLLNVSETTVERLINSGQLPVYRISRACTRLDRADVLAYIQSRRSKAADLRQRRVVGPKDIRARQQAGPSGYRPGMKVVDPRG